MHGGKVGRVEGSVVEVDYEGRGGGRTGHDGVKGNLNFEGCRKG